MNEIILVIIVIIVLLVILTILLGLITKRINLLMKNVFVNKLSELDFLLGDKEEKLNKINALIVEKEKLLETLNDDIESNSVKSERVDNSNEVVLPKYADFEDGNLLQSYKKIKEKFDFNIEEAIRQFIVKKVDEKKNKYYDDYKKIRNYFSYDVVYKLSTFQNEEQYLIICELLTEKDKILLKDILVRDKFNLEKFLIKLDNMILKSNPEIKIVVGDKKLNFDDARKNIITVYDKNIMEGFKIIYKGIVYDFSV